MSDDPQDLIDADLALEEAEHAREQAAEHVDDEPSVTEDYAAEVAADTTPTAAEDPPYQDVVSVRRDGRQAILTVNGNETVLNQHDAQSLWRELSAIVPVI